MPFLFAGIGRRFALAVSRHHTPFGRRKNRMRFGQFFGRNRGDTAYERFVGFHAVQRIFSGV